MTTPGKSVPLNGHLLGNVENEHKDDFAAAIAVLSLGGKSYADRSARFLAFLL
jgi:hypothetical protein